MDRVRQALRSLTARLVFSHLVVIAIATFVGGFSLLTLARGYFIQAVEDSLLAQAELIAAAMPGELTTGLPTQPASPAYNTVQQQIVGNLSVQVLSDPEQAEAVAEPALSQSNLAFLNQTTLQISTSLQTHIRVVDAEGLVLVDTERANRGQVLRDEATVSAALSGRQASSIITRQRVEWLYVAAPLLSDRGVSGAIVLGQPLEDVSSVLSDLRLRLLLAASLAVLSAALIAIGLARRIARPVRELSLAAEKLSQGDFDYPIRESGPSELDQLSRTFVAMRDRLSIVERVRSQFVSDVSHELRTPLTAIKGLAETLKDGAVNDTQVRDRFLDSIDRETDRLVRLANDLLILSRADADGLSLHLTAVSIEPLLRDASERLHQQAVERGIGIRLAVLEPGLKAHADGDRLIQVTLILLDNAIKHTPRDGSVEIAANRRSEAQGQAGDWIVICVTDTGEGIPASDLPHVFERFYRADQSRSRDQGGSGLGLSIAKALVEAHGGLIWITSPAYVGDSPVGRGTRAAFAIPRAD